jgi:hypothetical protein
MTKTITCDLKTHAIVWNIVWISKVFANVDGVGNTPFANIASKFITWKDDKDKIRWKLVNVNTRISGSRNNFMMLQEIIEFMVMIQNKLALIHK